MLRNPHIPALRERTRTLESTTLTIQETFQNTIQGEGFFSGVSCDFIRLWGCPVGCSWCDQGFAAEKGYGANLERDRRPVSALVAEVKSSLVVISGGEPLAQKNVTVLMRELIKAGHQVSVETSGAVWLDDLPPQVWVTLSPKEHVVKRRGDVCHKFWRRANEIKIVVETGNEVEFYRDRLNDSKAHLYLQPEWERREETIPIALEMLRQHPRACLSLQTHKYIGVQ